MTPSDTTADFEELVEDWRRSLEAVHGRFQTPLADNAAFRFILRRKKGGEGSKRDLADLPRLCAEAMLDWRVALEGTTAYYLGGNYLVGGAQGQWLTAWRRGIRRAIVGVIAYAWAVPFVAAALIHGGLPAAGSVWGVLVLLLFWSALVSLREWIRDRFQPERLEREAASKAMRLFLAFERGAPKRAAIAGLKLAAAFLLLYPLLLLFYLCGFLGLVPLLIVGNDPAGGAFFEPLSGGGWVGLAFGWSVLAGGYIFCAVVRAVEWMFSPSLSRIERRFAEVYGRLTGEGSA
jgi:hypothetical protein